MVLTAELKQWLAAEFWRGWSWHGKRFGWDDMSQRERAEALAYYEARLRREWNEDDHPRAPAGGPDGGQFTSAEGGGGSSAAPTPSTPSTPPALPAEPASPTGSVHSGGHVTPEMFEEGEAGYSKFENLNYQVHNALHNSGPSDSSAQKHDVVTQAAIRVSKDPRWTKAFGSNTGVADSTNYGRANQIVHAWACTSGDHDALSVAMQLATRDEFSLPGTATKHMVDGWGGKESRVWEDAADQLGGIGVRAAKGALRAFSRAEYDETQEWLAARGIKEVAVFRGMGRALGRQNYVVGSTTLQPMSSFSTSLNTARGFVPYGPRYKQNVLASVVPAKAVLSTARSGRGCLSESEIVVLGNKMGFIGFQKDSKFPPPKGKIKWPKGKAWSAKADGEDVVDLSDLRIDEDLEDADWTKQSWDLPPYKSPEFNALVPDLAHFRTLPVYRHAVEAGLIVHDTWVAKPDQDTHPGSLTRAFARQRGAVFLDDKRTNKEFNEDDHPRDDHGRFTDSGDGGSSDAKPPTPTGSPTPAPLANAPLLGGNVSPEMFDRDPGQKTKFDQENRKLAVAIGIPTHSPDDFDNPEARELVGRLSSRLSKDPAWTKAIDKYGTATQVESILAQWASTSGDTDAFAVAMQLATREEFDLKGSATKHLLEGFSGKEGEVWEKAAWHLGGVKPEDVKGALRAFARAEYTQTQEWLASKGIKEVAVFRGMDRAIGRQTYAVGTTTLQPMSSFTADLYKAQDFALGAKAGYRQTVLATMVPAKDVLSTCRTGRGTWEESEVVVLGNKLRFLGFSANADYPPPKGKVKWPGGKAAGDVNLDDLHIDEDLLNADWTKQTWALPPYKSDAFNALGFDLNNFRTLPVYKHAVAKGLIKNDEWVGPQKGIAGRLHKAGPEDEPRDDQGRWTDAGGGSSRDKPEGKPAASAKVRNALATYKPSTKEKQDRATAAEQKIAKMLGGKGTDDNSPMDVTIQVGRKTIGVEVKSVQDNGNNKITMHPASLQRKKDWEAAGKGRSVHTVVVDTRYNKIYYRAGAGSFRLHTLTLVKDAKHLRSLIGI